MKSGQVVQISDLSTLLYLPASQLVHVVEAMPEILPEGQGRQAVLAGLEKEPAEQGLQKPAPSSLTKPGSQSMQSSKLVPPVAENFPEGHAIQSLKTSWKYVPVKHCSQ
jgi:hypothetical protein